MSADKVRVWWNLLDYNEKEDVRLWWSDKDHQPFPGSAGVKQVEALLISPGNYVGEMTTEVTQFLEKILSDGH